MHQKIEGYRLSPQQHSVWHFQQQHRLPYRAQCLMTIAGELDLQLLQKALQSVIARLEILRTTFYTLPNSDNPVQVIGKADNAAISLIDSVDVFDEISQHPFDLLHGPLAKFFIVKLSEREHQLIVSTHALCAD